MDTDALLSVRNTIRRITKTMAKNPSMVSRVDVGMVQTETVGPAEYARLFGTA